MTIDDAKLPLLTFFSKSDIFDIDKDFKANFFSLDPKVDREIVILALKEFEKQGIAQPFNAEGSRMWVLTKPLAQYSQMVEIKYITITAIVKLINDLCEKMKDDEHKVDPLAITEKDIQNLIILASENRETKNK